MEPLNPRPGRSRRLTTTYQSSTNIGLTLYFHTTNADWDDIQVRRLVAVEPSVTWGGFLVG